METFIMLVYSAVILLVVRTLRCRRNKPGSISGHGMICFHIYLLYFVMN